MTTYSESLSQCAEILFGFFEKKEAATLSKLLMEHYSGFSLTEILVRYSENIPDSVHLNFLKGCERLTHGEPIQYIMGYAWFRDLKIKVGPGVLIPRPETEELAGLGTAFLKKQPNVSFIDLCCGSGCIGISILKSLKYPCSGIFYDLSDQALAFTRENLVALGLEASVEKYDVLSSELPNINQKVDLLISNPPYIPIRDKPSISIQVLKEPELALFVPNEDPLLFYNEIGKKAKVLLKPGGALMVECYSDFAEIIAPIYIGMGFKETTVIKDFLGKNRFITCFNS